MRNVIDYIYWRGDLTFEQDNFNEIDALILSELSYIDFNHLAPILLEENQLTLKEAAKHWDKADRKAFMPSGFLHHELAYEALSLAGNSDRFKDVLIAEDIKQVSKEDESQFGVTTFVKDEKLLYIGFEGTDLQSLGWKEDLQMSYLPMVPSQQYALDYLNQIFSRYPMNVAIGGHSKGGNLATYAAIYIEKKYQSFIDTVYDFDGPGFQKDILDEEGYYKMQDKIKSYVPQEGIVGLMLYKLNEPIIVYSNGEDVHQHDVFTWEIKGNRFLKAKLSKSAKQIQQLMSDLMDELSLKEREHFSEALFTILGDSEDDYIIGDRMYNLERIPRIIIEFHKLDTEQKLILLRVLRIFYRKRLQLI